MADGGGLHHLVQLGLHVGHGLFDGGFESGVLEGVDARIGLPARHAADAAEKIG